jgi:protocatechuate 3,4-dioxygenase beta subunit
MTPPHIYKKLTRREMLGFMGIATAAAAAAACGSSSKPAAKATGTPGATSTAAATSAATGTPASSALSCIVSPAMTEGPYFVDEMLRRSDITTDPTNGAVSAGVPLKLTINVQNVDGSGACTPLAGAHIDIWHCDAGGSYSDEQANNTVGQKFLRGYQLTDANGNVQFATIYPGWYMGRAVHIHMKVRTDPTSQQGYEFTSQLFFDDSLSDQVFAQAPYNTRGARHAQRERQHLLGRWRADDARHDAARRRLRRHDQHRHADRVGAVPLTPGPSPRGRGVTRSVGVREPTKTHVGRGL